MKYKLITITATIALIVGAVAVVQAAPDSETVVEPVKATQAVVEAEEKAEQVVEAPQPSEQVTGSPVSTEPTAPAQATTATETPAPEAPAPPAEVTPPAEGVYLQPQGPIMRTTEVMPAGGVCILPAENYNGEYYVPVDDGGPIKYRECGW